VRRHTGDLRREALTGGEPLLNARKDLALFFPGRGRPNKVLNRRLPETIAGDVLSSAPFGDSSSAQRAGRPNTRSNVRGSRLFNEICGLPHAETNIAGFFRHDPKRLPSIHAAMPKRLLAAGFWVLAPTLALSQLLLILPPCFSAS
jgi:hypothetical protein